MKQGNVYGEMKFRQQSNGNQVGYVTVAILGSEQQHYVREFAKDHAVTQHMVCRMLLSEAIQRRLERRN